MLEGKSAVGVAAGQCDPQAPGSSILFGLTQGDAIPANTGVPQISPLAIGQTPVVTATFGNAASSALQAAPAGQVQWSRSAAGSWSCSTINVDIRFKPAGC